MMDQPVAALQQSFLRTKTRDLKDFLERRTSCRPTVRTTPSSPTPRARSPIFIRSSCRGADDRFDYTKPVDGSDPATDWGSLHAIAELPNVDQPAERLGPQHQQLAVPRRRAEQPRRPRASRNIWTCSGRITAGIHALQLLTGSSGWTLERLQAAAYDSYQPGFAELIPLADQGL